jgi:hypothetical protein
MMRREIIIMAGPDLGRNRGKLPRAVLNALLAGTVMASMVPALSACGDAGATRGNNGGSDTPATEPVGDGELSNGLGETDGNNGAQEGETPDTTTPETTAGDPFDGKRYDSFVDMTREVGGYYDNLLGSDQWKPDSGGGVVRPYKICDNNGNVIALYEYNYDDSKSRSGTLRRVY